MQDPENNTPALLALLQHLLPSSTTSTLTQPTDLVAAYVHALLVSLRFRLNATPDGAEDRSSDAQGHEAAGNNVATGGGGADDDTVSEPDTVVADDEQQGETLPDERFTSLGISVADAEASRLPAGWNARGEDSYTFTYRHQQSQMTFTFKVGRIGNRVSVMGMAEVSALFLVCLCISVW
jgi:proteasome inhibitor subunit 1 (PI31)